MSSSQLFDATAALTLPGGALIPASFNAERIQPAVIDFDAALIGPFIVRNSSSGPPVILLGSDFLISALIQVIGHTHMLGCFSRCQPDCLKLALSVFDPNTGHKMISSPRLIRWPFEIFSRVKSCIRLPDASRSIIAALLEISKSDKLSVFLVSQSNMICTSHIGDFISLGFAIDIDFSTRFTKKSDDKISVLLPEQKVEIADLCTRIVL